MDKPKEKRKNIRVPLLSENCKWKLMDGINTHESRLIDFSSSGAFIQSAQPVPIGAYVDVSLKLPADLGMIHIEAQVKWQRWAIRKKDASKYDLGYGVQFINVESGPQKIIDSFGTYLRNKQIIAVSKKIIEEFFAGVPPNQRK